MSTIASPGVPTPSRLANTATPTLSGQSEPKTSLTATLLAIYIFLLTGRVLDVSWLAVFHIPMFMLILLMIMTVARGGLQHAFSVNATKYFAAFTTWVVICFPFSYWRAGSMPSVQYQVQAFVIYVIIVQAVRTRESWHRVASAYAYATLIAALLSFKIGVNIQGRISLPAGTLGDPNEFALVLALGLPFWWLKADRASGIRKGLFLLATLPIYVAFSRTGSRSGMLALGVLFLFTFLFARGGNKLMIAMGVLVALVAASLFLPDYLRTRYLTFFSHDAENLDAKTRERLGADIASSEERKALLFQSIAMTFHHPIVGVGPGDFSYVSWDERKATTGSGGENLVSHNTYTQISSETGIPGFIFFVATVVLSFRSVLGDYKRLKDTDEELVVYARYLLTAASALFVGIFFLSVGYTHMLAVIFALATSLHYLAQEERETVPAAANLQQSNPVRGELPNRSFSPGSRRPLRWRMIHSRIDSPVRRERTL